MSAPGEPNRDVLEAVITAVAQESAVSAEELSVSDVRRLSGGASRLTWILTIAPEGTEVVLQAERPGSAGANLAMGQQARLVAAARDAGVPVPRVIASGTAEDGAGYAVLSKLPGESLPRRILNDPTFDAVRGELAGQLGEACARIHSLDPALFLEDALREGRLPEGLPAGSPPDPLESMTTFLDGLGESHPAFELGLRWLAENRPPERPATVLHGDLRMGNLLIDASGLTGVLDWELAHLGSPAEDLGWFCARAWRFGSPLRAGGVGDVSDLLEGYRRGGGEPPDEAELDWWEAYACLRWGLICVLQASVHLSGAHRSVELAAIGRRAAECEEDLLELVAGASGLEPPTEPREPGSALPGRPTGSELLVAVSEHLDQHRSGLVGAESFQMRVARNVVDMVRRELDLGEELARRHVQRMDSLGVSGDAQLAAEIRDGQVDSTDPFVIEAIRAGVRDKLAVSHPGYWHGDDRLSAEADS